MVVIKDSTIVFFAAPEANSLGPRPPEPSPEHDPVLGASTAKLDSGSKGFQFRFACSGLGHKS